MAGAAHCTRRSTSAINCRGLRTIGRVAAACLQIKSRNRPRKKKKTPTKRTERVVFASLRPFLRVILMVDVALAPPLQGAHVAALVEQLQLQPRVGPAAPVVSKDACATPPARTSRHGNKTMGGENFCFFRCGRFLEGGGRAILSHFLSYFIPPISTFWDDATKPAPCTRADSNPDLCSSESHVSLIHSPCLPAYQIAALHPVMLHMYERVPYVQLIG